MNLATFCMGIMILDGKCSDRTPFLYTICTQAGACMVDACFQILLHDFNPHVVTPFLYVCLVLCNSVQVATHKPL